MNGKYVKIVLLGALAAIAAVLVFDYLSNKPGKLPSNPYEYNVDEYKKVDETQISHIETRQISIKEGKPKAIAYNQGNILLLIDNYLQIIRPDGKELIKKYTGENSGCLIVADNQTIIVGFNTYLVAFDLDGNEINRSSNASENALFTALAVSGDKIFVADAGTKQVLVFDKELRQTLAFKGESGVSDQHGFIIPSAHFDLAVNTDDELWVVNPGMHALQNYSAEGRLIGYWSKSSFEPEGFSGCCNPFYIAFLSDGNIVTSEKGLIRIKIHAPSGALISIVASPDQFTDGKRAPALAVDDKDNILALDFDKHMIRFFEPK